MRRRSLRSRLFNIGCTAALGLAALDTAAAAEAEVALRFAWPDGLRAVVSHTKSRTRGEGPMARTSSLATHFDLVAGRVGSQLRISFGPLQLDSPAPAEPMSAQDRNTLELVATATMPSFLVNADGAFAGLQDPARAQADLRQLLLRLLPAAASAEAMRPVLEAVTSEPMVASTASNDWNLTVGHWAGATLEIGESCESTSRTPMPLVPNAMVGMISTFSVLQAVPCSRSGQARRCVDIELTSRLDSDDMARVIADLVRRFAKGGKVPDTAQLKSLDSVSVLRLRTEPDGLIPHSYRFEKSSTVTVLDAGAEKVTHDKQVTQVTYRYPDRAP